MKELHKKRIKKFITVSLALLICGYVWLDYVFFVITREGPHWDGIWANEDRSFILNTDNTSVIITNGSTSEALDIAYSPGTDFVMFHPIPEGEGIYHTVHEGEIYRIFSFVHVKCEDGCFDTWLQKVETPDT